jgi:hypothetical protein
MKLNMLMILLCLLTAPVVASAQSAETGCTQVEGDCEPLRIEPGWPGSKIRGTVLIDFFHADGQAGEGGTVTARLEANGDVPDTFFATLPDYNYDLNHMNESLAVIIEQVRADVLARFFPESCGDYGDECETDIGLRKLTNVSCRLMPGGHFRLIADVELGTGSRL